MQGDHLRHKTVLINNTLTLGTIYWTYKIAGPSPSIVSVMVWSMFHCGQCFSACSQCTGEDDIWGPSGIVARRHLCDCAKTSGVLWYRTCQNIDCAKTLTASNHWQQQNIDRAKTSTTPFYAVVFFLSPRDKSFKLLYVKFHQKIKKKLRLKAYLNWFAPLARLHARTSIELES